MLKRGEHSTAHHLLGVVLGVDDDAEQPKGTPLPQHVQLEEVRHEEQQATVLRYPPDVDRLPCRRLRLRASNSSRRSRRRRSGQGHMSAGDSAGEFVSIHALPRA